MRNVPFTAEEVASLPMGFTPSGELPNRKALNDALKKTRFNNRKLPRVGVRLLKTGSEIDQVST